MVAYERTLAYKLPALAQQWDHEKNDKTPSDVTASNAYKAWWICPTCSHSWQQSVNNRKNGKGCPNCAGRIIQQGNNDFASVSSRYISWWADDKNPDTVFNKSRSIVKWKCPHGHFFMKSVKTFDGRCPKCVDNPLAAHSPHLIVDWSKTNTFLPSDVSYNSAKNVEWSCHVCNHIWITPVYQRANGSNCPKCNNMKKASADENKIAQSLTNYGLTEGEDFLRHKRGLIQGNLELDFYFPYAKLAIEYNGLYWHSEDAGKDKRFHFNKWQQCQERGIQLIQIWEDDYQRNPHLVHRMILHKLSLTSEKKIAARKCTLVEVKHSDAFTFLAENHIQSKVQGSHYTGLTYAGELVALSVWTKRGKTLYLDRYATSAHVVGGLGKLLAHVVRQADRTVTEIVTFAANDVSNGNLYEKLGFKVDKVLKPDYSYLYGKQRVHKFNFRIARFKKDPNLLFEEGKTEKELALMNNIPRIWDAGKIRYILPINSC